MVGLKYFNNTTNTWEDVIPIDKINEYIERLEYNEYLSWMEQYYQNQISQDTLNNVKGMRIFPFDIEDNPDGSWAPTGVYAHNAQSSTTSGTYTNFGFSANQNNFTSTGYCNLTTGYVEYDVYGDRVVVVMGKGTNQGIAQISIDGAVVDASVDLYQAGSSFPSSSTAMPFFVKSYTLASGGAHKVRIANTGTKNASSSNTQISILNGFYYHSNQADVNTVREVNKLLVAGKPVNSLANYFISDRFVGNDAGSGNNLPSASTLPSLSIVQNGTAWSTSNSIITFTSTTGGKNQTIDFNVVFAYPVQIDNLSMKIVVGSDVAMNASAQIQGVWVSDDFINWTSVGSTNNFINNATTATNSSGSGEPFTYPAQNAGATINYPFTTRTVRGMRVRFYLATTSTSGTLEFQVQEFKINTAPIPVGQYHYKTTVLDTAESSKSHRLYVSSLYLDKLGLKVTNDGTTWKTPTLVSQKTDARFPTYQEGTYDVEFDAEGSKCGLKFDFDSAVNSTGNEVKRACVIQK